MAGFVAVIAEDDVAVKIVAVGVGGPFVADKRGEAAGLVVVFRGGDGFLPGALVGACAGEIHEVLRKCAVREGHDDFDGCITAFAALDHVIPLAAGGICKDFRFAGEEVGEEAHVVGMIGDDQEVQRAGKLGGLAAGSHDFLAAGEAIGVARAEPAAKGSGIH